MIHRHLFDSPEADPATEPAPLAAALQQASLSAAALGQSLQALQDEAAHLPQRLAQNAPPSEPMPLAVPGPFPPAPSVDAPPPETPAPVPNIPGATEPSPAPPTQPAVGAEPPPTAPQQPKETTPPVDSPPSPDDALAGVAAELARRAAEIQSAQSNADLIHQSLSTALALMNEIASQVATQSELRDVASQVESLQAAVNDLHSRMNVSRVP